MLCDYLCASTLFSWIALAPSAFKYADEEGGYKYLWTLPFKRRYEPHQARVQAIEALNEKLNATFCDISYINTIDPWLKHNQTRYKIFVIAPKFEDQAGFDRQYEVKQIVQLILNNPSDSRVEIVAKSPKEKPEGFFTEEEMKYNINFMDAEKMPIFGGNRIKRNVHEWIPSTDEPADMSWKFPPNKTCQLVEEIIRQKFDPIIVKCESLHEMVRGRVGPGHEDQYKLLVVSKKFLDQPMLRRTINVRRAIDELVTQQMYKIHMRLKTMKEYEAEKNIVTTTDFSVYQ